MPHDSRDQTILKMYLAGERSHIIAKRVGLTKQRIIQIAKAMGAPSRIYEPLPGQMGWMLCNVDGCNETSRSKWGTLCNKHFSRGRRTGKTDDREPASPKLTSHGYLASWGKGHPASMRNGVLYAHRRAFYDAFGPAGHNCKWCGMALIWGGRGSGMLHVDHLNGDKTDNDPDNLVPSCPACNQRRGSFMAWLARHKDDPVIRALFAAASNLSEQISL